MSKIIKDGSMVKNASPKQLYPEYKREDKKAPKHIANAKITAKTVASNVSPQLKSKILEAEQIIGAARIEAKSIISDAENKAAEILDKAKTEGLAQGYEQGHKQGLEKGLEQYKQATKHSLDNLTQIIEEVILQREKLIKNTEKEVIDIAFAIAHKVIEAELESNNKAVISNVRKALEKVVSDTRIKLKIAPQDYEAVRDEIDRLAGKTGVSGTIDISADSNISPGGCLIDTDSGRIDVQISAQLEELRKSMMKHNDKS